VPIFGTSEIRNAETDTSVVRSVDIRYIDLSEDRNADLDNLDTRKSTTIHVAQTAMNYLKDNRPRENSN